jgi:hypothetical protein
MMVFFIKYAEEPPCRTIATPNSAPIPKPCFRGVVFIKTLEIFIETFVHRLDQLLQRVFRVVAVLVVDRLDPRAIDAKQLAPEQIELRKS